MTELFLKESLLISVVQMIFYILVVYLYCILIILCLFLNFQQYNNKFLILKAKYYVVEPHYIKDSTPYKAVLIGSGF